MKAPLPKRAIKRNCWSLKRLNTQADIVTLLDTSKQSELSDNSIKTRLFSGASSPINITAKAHSQAIKVII